MAWKSFTRKNASCLAHFAPFIFRLPYTWTDGLEPHKATPQGVLVEVEPHYVPPRLSLPEIIRQHYHVPTTDWGQPACLGGECARFQWWFLYRCWIPKLLDSLAKGATVVLVVSQMLGLWLLRKTRTREGYLCMQWRKLVAGCVDGQKTAVPSLSPHPNKCRAYKNAKLSEWPTARHKDIKWLHATKLSGERQAVQPYFSFLKFSSKVFPRLWQRKATDLRATSPKDRIQWIDARRCFWFQPHAHCHLWCAQCVFCKKLWLCRDHDGICTLASFRCFSQYLSLVYLCAYHYPICQHVCLNIQRCLPFLWKTWCSSPQVWTRNFFPHPNFAYSPTHGWLQELYDLRSEYGQKKRALTFCNSTFSTLGEKKFCILHLLEEWVVVVVHARAAISSSSWLVCMYWICPWLWSISDLLYIFCWCVHVCTHSCVWNHKWPHFFDRESRLLVPMSTSACMCSFSEFICVYSHKIGYRVRRYIYIYIYIYMSIQANQCYRTGMHLNSAQSCEECRQHVHLFFGCILHCVTPICSHYFQTYYDCLYANLSSHGYIFMICIHAQDQTTSRK